MTLGHAAVYGFVQGATEFLPVSSSAHLALLPKLLGIPDPGLTFDVALHMGTLAAVIGYFARDWWQILSGAARDPRGEQCRRLVQLAAATVPAAVVGVLLEERVETVFRDPLRISVTLAVFGLLLAAADRWGRRSRSLEAVGWRETLGVGLAQALALVPGVSRSGVTITAGLTMGLTGDAAARLSFLLALPITAGAGVFKLRHLSLAEVTPDFWVGILVSALTGAAAVHILLKQVRGRGLWPYALYRLALAGALVAYFR